MRAFPAAVAVTLAALISTSAPAQVYVTSITAAFPDPNGQVPAFNAVPGAGIPNWSNGLAQAVLAQGQAYNYCISLASAVANGKAEASFKIARGSTVIQSAVIISKKDFTVGPNGVWYLCSGYLVLPNNPGAATLSGTVAYYPKGQRKADRSTIDVPVLLQ